MDKKGKDIKTHKMIIVLIVSTSLLFFLLAFIFIKYTQGLKPSKKHTSKEMISINYSSNVNGIKMDGFKPIKDDDGKKEKDRKKMFNFKVTSKIEDKKEIKYEVALEKSDDCNLKSSDIKVYLERENEGTYIKIFDPTKFNEINKKTKIGTPKGDMVLFDGSYTSSLVDKYRLKVWVDEKSSKKDKIVCTITAKVYAKAK